MLKSRLYWKVLANFGILIAIITAMTVLSGTGMRTIESNFQNASADTRFLEEIEQVQHELASLPHHAHEYARTGDLNERLLYERQLREVSARLTELIESTGDSLSLNLLEEAEKNLIRWEKEAGAIRIRSGDRLSAGNGSSVLNDVYSAVRNNDRYLDYTRNILREVYNERLTAHRNNIDQASHISQNAGTYIYIVNFLVILFAIALGLILTRSIVKPLRKLRESTARLTDGTFEPVDVDRNDELGDLAGNINKTSAMLYSQYKKIKVYSDLVTHLNAVSNIRSVAGRSLSHLCIHTGAYAGAVYLLNRQTDLLERVNSLGFESNSSASHDIPTGEGYIGQCAKSGERIEIAFNNTAELEIPGFPPDKEGYVTVTPMEFRNSIIGVLLLASHDPFDSEQSEIVNQSMQQIAVSITNARHYEETQNLSLEIAHKNKELQRKNKELEKAYRVKSDFLASISHELRTPLNSVIGYSTALLSPEAERLTNDQTKAIGKVLKNGKHLLSIINDILDISKIEAGRMSLSVDTDSVRNVVEQSISAIEPMLADKKLHLKKSLQKDVPPLKTDIIKIRQIIINLLGNAVKFTKKGTINVRVYYRDRLIHFEVRDPGIGIAEENHEAIFEEFRQIDSGNGRRYQGTGLGLPIARRLARLLGGDLNVKSRPGKGSIFTLSIPPTILPKPGSNGNGRRPEHAQPQDEMTFTFDTYKNSQSNPHILCIDDDPDAIDILRNFLVPEGYSVTGALTGDEGIVLAKEIQPRLITLDVLMPGKDGWQVLRELKQSPDTRHIPVIIHSIIDNQPLALSLGAIDVMPKPVDANKLMSLVQLSCMTKDQYVLLVDDNQEFAMVMSELIEHDGFRVKTADNGIRALEMIEESRPAIIFLDLVMPEMDGFDFIKKIKENETLRDIPVIILSGKALNGQERDFLETHMHHYMKKEEFSHEAIVNSIKRILVSDRYAEETYAKQR